MRNYRNGLLTLTLAITSLFIATAHAQAPAKTPAKSAKPALKVIALPDAYSGMPYNLTINSDSDALKAPAVCIAAPALPSWLKLDCSDGNFKFTGTVPAVAKDDSIVIALRVVDSNPKDYNYKLTLTLRPAVETVFLGKAPKASPTPAAPTQADFDKMTLLQTIPIQESGTQAAGQILHVPAGAKLNLQIWSTQPGQQPAQLQLVNPSAPPATLAGIDLKSGGSYTAQFPQALAAGQSLQFKLFTADGADVKDFPAVSLSPGIDLAGAKLNLEEPLVSGSKTISGTLSGLPNPLIRPVAASGATPATYGNVPGVVVWTTDPASGEWSQVIPAPGASPFQFQSVNADSGSFSITLPSALVSRQKVRVDVVPPPHRTFIGLPSFDPPTKPLNPALDDLSKTLEVITDASISVPTISSTPFNEGITVISGTATPTSGGFTSSIAVLLLDKSHYQDMNNPDLVTGFSGCPTADNLEEANGHYRVLPLTSSSSNTLLGNVDTNAGTYKVTLAEALKQGDWVQVVQVLPAGAKLPDEQKKKCASIPHQVQYPYEFHRTNLTFVAGVVLSNSSASSAANANFSQANQFFAFNADRAWRQPGYDCINGKQWGNAQYGACGPGRNDPGWHSDRWYKPGISTAFESRLTSIPVSTPAANPTATTSSTGSTSTTSSSTTSTLLSSQKVFRVATIAYLPWVVSHGGGDHPNGLFIAPLAKAGFDTVAGSSTSSNVILPNATPGTLNFQSAYKFYAYGGRIGNMSLSASHDRAPLLEHYLDVTVGRYTNLQSYICHTMPTPSTSSTAATTAPTTCATQYPTLLSNGLTAVDSRKQLYRLDFEGLVRIPVPATAIPFYIGFNANISQHTIGAERLDHGYTPPDDIRILFGTKIDVGTLLSTFKLGTN